MAAIQPQESKTFYTITAQNQDGTWAGFDTRYPDDKLTINITTLAHRKVEITADNPNRRDKATTDLEKVLTFYIKAGDQTVEGQIKKHLGLESAE